MDRRLFLTGLLGVAGTAALATAMPRQAGAATGDPLAELRPPRPEDFPEWELAEEPEEDGVQVAQRGPYWRGRRGRGRRRGHRRGRRYSRRGHRHWRRYSRRRHRHWRHGRYRYWDDTLVGSRCRRYVNRWGEWVRRCYRSPFGFGLGVWF